MRSIEFQNTVPIISSYLLHFSIFTSHLIMEPASPWIFGNSSVRVITQGFFRPYMKTFVPTWLTAPGSRRMLSSYLSESNILLKYQSGFLFLHLTVSSLLEAIDNCAFHIDSYWTKIRLGQFRNSTSKTKGRDFL